MTCIVGLTHKGKVWMGGDSVGVAGLSTVVRLDPKVFENGEFLFGFAGSFRMGQILHYSFVPPHQPDKLTDIAFMSTLFIDKVRTVLRDKGFAKNEDGEETGGNFLVGYRGQLYEIGDDFQVGVTAHGFNSIGCGQDLAMGSLYTTGQTTMLNQSKKRVQLALEAAEAFNGGVKGPFIIKSI